MKKIKLLNVLGATLLAAITITMPIVLVSCSTSETPPLTPLQIYKDKISDSGVFVNQEAIDMLGTELYRHENGLNILDLSHWGRISRSFSLDVFNKPVDKVIWPVDNNSRAYVGLFPKLKNDDLNNQLWMIYQDFALKGHFKINFTRYDDTEVLDGYKVSNDYIMTDVNIDSSLWQKFGAYPLSTFKKISKITLNTKKNKAYNTKFEHASLPYAFSEVDKNDPELVEYNGKKYPGIVTSKEHSAQAVSAIIPFSDGTRFLNGKTVNRQWPGFVKSDKTLGEGFYYAPLHDQSLKVFFTTLEDVNQFFAETYDTYAKANLSDTHIQNNYQTLLKIFPHKDSTPQNPKIDWSGIQPLYNNELFI